MNLKEYIFNNACRLILIGCFVCAFHNITKGQTKPKHAVDIEIYGGQNGNLYTDGSNLISIMAKDTAATFTVKSSQGKVWQLDKYMFFVEDLQKGRTTIAVLRTDLGKDFLARKKDYTVLVPKLVTRYNSLSIPPNISLAGFTKGKVKLDTLKRITSLSIDENYTILQARFYVGNVDLTTTLIKSKYFDNHLKELWKRISPGCSIVIDNIEFMDKNGNRYFYPQTIALMAVE